MSKATNINVRISFFISKTQPLAIRLTEWRNENRIEIEDVPPVHANGRFFPIAIDRFIFGLLGFGSETEALHGWKPKHDKIVSALCGPNGWAIYKILLARKVQVGGTVQGSTHD